MGLGNRRTVLPTAQNALRHLMGVPPFYTVVRGGTEQWAIVGPVRRGTILSSYPSPPCKKAYNNGKVGGYRRPLTGKPIRCCTPHLLHFVGHHDVRVLLLQQHLLHRVPQPVELVLRLHHTPEP